MAGEQCHITASARAQRGTWLLGDQLPVMGNPAGQPGHCLTARAHPASASGSSLGHDGAPLQDWAGAGAQLKLRQDITL